MKIGGVYRRSCGPAFPQAGLPPGLIEPFGAGRGRRGTGGRDQQRIWKKGGRSGGGILPPSSRAGSTAGHRARAAAGPGWRGESAAPSLRSATRRGGVFEDPTAQNGAPRHLPDPVPRRWAGSPEAAGKIGSSQFALAWAGGRTHNGENPSQRSRRVIKAPPAPGATCTPRWNRPKGGDSASTSAPNARATGRTGPPRPRPPSSSNLQALRRMGRGSWYRNIVAVIGHVDIRCSWRWDR